MPTLANSAPKRFDSPGASLRDEQPASTCSERVSALAHHIPQRHSSPPADCGCIWEQVDLHPRMGCRQPDRVLCCGPSSADSRLTRRQASRILRVTSSGKQAVEFQDEKNGSSDVRAASTDAATNCVSRSAGRVAGPIEQCPIVLIHIGPPPSSSCHQDWPGIIVRAICRRKQSASRPCKTNWNAGQNARAPQAKYRPSAPRRPAYCAYAPSSSSIRSRLVVLGQSVGARQRAGLDLPAVRGHRQVGDGGILGLARAVRHHRALAGACAPSRPRPASRSASRSG